MEFHPEFIRRERPIGLLKHNSASQNCQTSRIFMRMAFRLKRWLQPFSIFCGFCGFLWLRSSPAC